MEVPISPNWHAIYAFQVALLNEDKSNQNSNWYVFVLSTNNLVVFAGRIHSFFFAAFIAILS